MKNYKQKFSLIRQTTYKTWPGKDQEKGIISAWIGCNNELAERKGIRRLYRHLRWSGTGGSNHGSDNETRNTGGKGKLPDTREELDFQNRKPQNRKDKTKHDQLDRTVRRSLAHADKPHCRFLTSMTHTEMTGLHGSQSGQMAKLQVGVQMIPRKAAQANKARWEI